MEVNAPEVSGPFAKSLADSLRGHAAGAGAEVKPGTVFGGRYRCKEALGDHGPIALWVGEDVQHKNQTVMLKVLPPGFSGDEEAVKALLPRLHAVRGLKHPHIVPLLDVVQDQGRIVVVCQDVLGKTLFQLHDEREHGCFDHTDIKKWIGQLCDALHHAHNAGVPHQDIRPGHLIVNEQGDLQVADFVLARVGADWARKQGVELTGPELVYRSPQALDSPGGPADDVYAVGVLIFELLAGRLPFSGVNPQRQIREVVPPAVSGARAVSGYQGKPVPPKWETAVARCLEKAPEKRPRSMRDLGLSLGVGQAAFEAKRTGAQGGKPWGKWLARAGYAFGGLAVLGLTAGLSLWFFRVALPEREARAAEQRQQQEAQAAQAAEEARKLAEAEEAKKQAAQQAEAARAREAEAAAQAQAEAERLAKARGGIRLKTEPPGATVKVAGLEVKSPGDIPEVPIGPQAVVIELAGYHPVRREATVEEGKVADLGTIRLERQMSRLILKSAPSGAVVFYQGKRLGVTPLALPEVPVGRLFYEFYLPGYYAATVEASVVPGRDCEVNALLSPTPGPRPGKSFTNGINMDMVWVPAIEGWVARTETTQEQFQRLMQSNPSAFEGPRRPVDNVTWNEAMEFCRRLTQSGRNLGDLPSNLGYRLPTVGEWEAFASGAVLPARRTGEEPGTLPSGSTPASGLGLHEVRGNVWEWCMDPYQGKKNLRVLRGGSWMNHGASGRAPDQDYNGVDDRGNHRGFRVVLKFDLPE